MNTQIILLIEKKYSIKNLLQIFYVNLPRNLYTDNG